MNRRSLSLPSAGSARSSAGLLLFALASCGSRTTPTTPTGAMTRAEIESSVETSLDRSVSACDDFYQFACGGWLAKNEIPSDRSRWFRSFSVIDERNENALKEILESGGESADAQKLATWYGTCNDEATIEARGIEPLKPAFATVESVKDGKTLMAALGNLPMTDAFFGIQVEADFKDPETNILYAGQSGIGLPERDFYFRDDEKSAEIRGKYVAHIAKMLELAGSSAADAQASATAIMALETSLAEVSKPVEELRDPNGIYHKIDRVGLQALTPSLPWDTFFGELGFPGITSINVMTPDFFTGLEKMVAKADAGEWKIIRDYLRWRVISGSADHLGKAFVDANFAFYGTVLSGQTENRLRWKRCVEATDGGLGELLGKVYVERKFAGKSKEIALDMIKRIEAAFEAGLPELSWMDDGTRKRALDKLKTITNKIGYPDKWRDYSGLEVKAGDWYGNVARSAEFETAYALEKVGKPVDPLAWHMSPPTVNAYYNPLENEIVFPAGILQPPFFSAEFPAAMNYGAMGMVMGHEVTHGFDDEGRKFSPTGALEEWWDPQASARFEERAECVEKLYDGYTVQDLHVNGGLTLGENIADFGGIKLATRAYAQWAKDNGAEEGLAGFTPEQLLYVGYAQGWCGMQKPEKERMQVQTDPHSPSKYRVNGPLSQLPAFAEAFDCPVGAPMHPAEICEVW